MENCKELSVDCKIIFLVPIYLLVKTSHRDSVNSSMPRVKAFQEITAIEYLPDAIDVDGIRTYSVAFGSHCNNREPGKLLDLSYPTLIYRYPIPSAQTPSSNS